MPQPIQSLLLTLLCLGSLPGQSTKRLVLPNGYRQIEGNFGTNQPEFGAPWGIFKGSQEFRSQSVIAIPSNFSGTLTALAWRRDGLDRGRKKTNGFVVDLRIDLSTATTGPGWLSKVFSQNEGKDRKLVLPRRKVIFPAVAFSYGFPESFGFRVPFQTPFPFRPKGRSLCVDLRHFGNDMMGPNGNKIVLIDAIAPIAQVASLSGRPECIPALAPPLRFVTAGSIEKNMVETFAWITGAEPKALCISFWGIRKLQSGIPLFCGTFMLDPAGIVMALPGKADNFGQARFPSKGFIPIPFAKPGISGVQLFAQGLTLFLKRGNGLAAANLGFLQVPTWSVGTPPDLGIRTVIALGKGSMKTVRGIPTPLGQVPVLALEYR
jgi:hypothetical protein